jgi:hypothetical protein
MKTWKRISVIGLVASLPLVSAAAIAFPKAGSWHTSASAQTPGGSDIFATGGVSDWGLTCANCHIKAPGLIDATVLPTPAWPLMGGLKAYSPTKSYAISVTLVGEHLKVNDATLPVPDNLNSFALAIEDQNGKPQGVFTTDGTNALFARTSTGPECASKNAVLPAGFWEVQPPATYTNNNTGTTFLGGDCHAIVNLSIPNKVNWKFTWTAPKAGTGPLTIYYGVVDGSSHGLNSQDDDVKMGTIKLLEGP